MDGWEGSRLSSPSLSSFLGGAPAILSMWFVNILRRRREICALLWMNVPRCQGRDCSGH